MASSQKESAAPANIPVDLRDPTWAALLAWLWPGAGHIYQRRYAKGALYMICILGIFFYGLMLGSGRVVYASWKPNDRRWQYVCQVGVGLPAFPAIAQSFKTKNGGKPYFPLAERFGRGPRTFDIMTEDDLANYEGKTLTDGFMAPPPGEVNPEAIDVLGKWHEELLHRFELGTLFTIVAGLHNILAVYDAFAGPAYEDPEEEKKRRKKKKRGGQDQADNQDEANDD